MAPRIKPTVRDSTRGSAQLHYGTGDMAGKPETERCAVFLWFWMAFAIVGVTLAAVVAITRSNETLLARVIFPDAL